jgi:hypothetical protein
MRQPSSADRGAGFPVKTDSRPVERCSVAAYRHCGRPPSQWSIAAHRHWRNFEGRHPMPRSGVAGQIKPAVAFLTRQ